MNQYALTPLAKRDLKDIWKFIDDQAQDSSAADEVIAKIHVEIEKIAAMPGVGHQHPSVRDPRFRFRLVYSYLIAYFPDTNPIAIVRVVHGSRDLKRLF